MEGHTDRVAAAGSPAMGTPGRKVRAPPGRVLGNTQASITGLPESGTESGTETYRPDSIGIRVKSDGKSVRPSAVTQRRLNPTWSKAK